MLVLAGVIGIFASPLGLISGTGLNAGALFLGGVLFLTLGIVLGIAGSGLLRLRPWSWWLAVFTTVAVLAWTLYDILVTVQYARIEWYVTVGIAAVVLGYLMTVHHFFQRPVLT